jgi:uncharacterized membrane protein
MSNGGASHRLTSVGSRIFIGVLTIAPLGITWLILDFLFAQLSRFGRPWINGIARAIQPTTPDLADLLWNDILQSIAAVVIVLVFLYLLGWAAGQVIGQRLIRFFEAVLGRIPFVDTIYRATKRVLAIAGSSPDTGKRVVLINFPSPEMKSLGLLTQTLRDTETGEELAAVFVPTAPNPTSGYIEILPMKDLIVTDWTFDQAMAFIVTGGSNSPEKINYRNMQATAAAKAL